MEKMNRETFLKLMTGSAALAVVPTGSAANAIARCSPTVAGGRVRFTAFADLHYMPGSWANSEDLSFLRGILDRAEKAKTDFVIHLGDFVHRTDRAEERAAIKAYADFAQPTYHVMGNHDAQIDGWQNALKAYGMKRNYYSFDCKGWRFIVADANYFKTKDGRYTHHERGNFAIADERKELVWATCIPPEQVEWIKKTIGESPYPCVFFSHESLERGWSIGNDREIRGIFESANRKSPGKVRLVINGHHHTDHVRVWNGIVYFELNSANYYWYGGGKSVKYPKEMLDKAEGLKDTIAWTDPLSAVITLDEHEIRIEGSHSTYLCNIRPEDVGYSSIDESVFPRQVVPYVSSFEYHTNYEVPL